MASSVVKGSDGGSPSASISPSVSLPECWLLFLFSLYRPLVTVVFLATGPHRPAVAAAWLLSLAGSLLIEWIGGSDLRQPPKISSSLLFDSLLYLIFGLQVVSFFLLGWFVAKAGVWSVDCAVAVLLAGLSSGYASVIVAHELIHRAAPHMQLMGRILLSLVVYEHWYTEHLRAHHVNVGRYDDAGSARYGESYVAFCLRSIPGQFVNAWRLERRRLGAEQRSSFGPWVPRSRVFHGILFQLALYGGLTVYYGFGALFVTLVQAFIAILLLEVVDYFAHWGLERSTMTIDAVHSWDTDSRMTLYAFVGLSRHADHHLNVFRPYYQLRRHTESPKLPLGYPGMALLAMFRNSRFRDLMSKELVRLGLRSEGPRIGVG